MPDERRRMPPGPNDRVSIDYGGFDTSGPLALSNLEQSGGGTNSIARLGMGVIPRFAISQLEKAKASGFVPYEERVAKYEKKHGDLPPNPLLTGLQAGFLGGFSGDVGFAETLSDMIPGDPGKESLKRAGDFLEREAYKYPMRTLRDIHDAGDFGGFVAQSIGQTFGYIGSMIPTTIMTGGVGAVSRIVGREALKGLTKKEIAKQGGKALGRAITAPSIVKNIGHTYRGVREETGVESPGIALPVGIASGMLERFGLGKSFQSFFDALPPGAKKELWGRMVASGLKAAGKSALIEGGTEAGQETLQLLANRLADSTYDIVNGENAWRVLDATAMGAFGAAPIGAVGGAGNYYTAVGEAQDRKLVEDVLKKVEAERRVHQKGSPILFAVGQREIQKHADLLDDNELIPTEEQVGALERFSERIQSQASLSPEQKQALQSNANSVLARFKERVGTAHADKKADEAQGKSDLETAARESREAAEAAVAPEQQAMPETAILPEERAPYNYPESAYQVGQEYKHRLHSTVGGETIQVDGVVTKVGSDGRVLESVVASTVNDITPTPLIVTRRKKTRSLHTQDEIEAEMDIAARVPSDPKFAKSAEEKSAEVQEITDRLKRDRGQAALEEQMAADAGVTIRVPKGRTAEQNIKKREEFERKKKTPLKEAKSVKFRKVYRAPEPAVSTAQSESALLNRAQKIIENSSVVEVSKPGEKRSVGAVVSSTLAPFAGETHGMRVFVAEVLFEDGETDLVTIKEDLSITQPMNGGVVVLAKNGKLTEEQEVVVSAAENVTEEQEAERVAAVRATHSQIFGKKQPRATAEASPHQEKPSKDVSLTKDAAQKTAKPEVKPTKGISGIELTDPALIAERDRIKKEQDDDAGMVLDITGAVPYAFKRLSQIIRLIILDIKQAIINKKIKRGFNKKARRSQKQGFMSYKELRQSVIEKHSEALNKIEIDNVNPHLPAYSDDPERFLGGIFDAVVDLGGEAIEGDVSQDVENEVLSKIEAVLRSYIDFPIADKVDEARSIVAANSNTYKNTDTGWTINGLDLYSDDMSEAFTAVLDFSTQHGNVISIKAMGKGMDALSYRLKPEAMERVRFQESEVEGREGVVTFAHIPESLLLDEDGNVQYDNWEYDSSKGGGRFLKDISWVGVSRDEFIELVKERTKSKRLRELLESEAGESVFSAKDQIAGIISNAVELAKDPRYRKLKKGKTAAFKAMSKISKAYIAKLKIDQLPKLFEHAVNLHLDHFVTLTEDQLSEVAPSVSEVNRLTAYRNKLKAAIEGDVPKLMDLPKIGTVVDTGEFNIQGKRKGKNRYRIENVPSDPNNLTPVLVTDIRVPMRDRYFSFAEKRGETKRVKGRVIEQDKWYVASMDEGIIEGPFETKDDADLYRPDALTPLRGRTKGSSLYESGRYYVGLGKDLEAAKFKVSAEIKDEAEAKAYVEIKDAGEELPPIPNSWKRKSLRTEDRKFAKEMLSEVMARIDQLKGVVDVAVGAQAYSTIHLQAPILPAIARKAAYEAKEGRIGDVDLVLEAQEGEDFDTLEREEFAEAVVGKGFPTRVGDAVGIIQNIREYIDGNAKLSDVFSNVFFYVEGIESEREKFGELYRTTLLVDEAKEVNLAAEAGDKVNKMGVAVGGETAATGEITPSDVIEKKEREVERGKFEEGGFEENTELGRASKRFRGARKKLVELIQKGDTKDDSWDGLKDGRLWHVTLTSRVEGLKKKGFGPGKKTYWKTGLGEPYGKGYIFTFENYWDAVGWAKDMDWEESKSFGSGKISILEIVDDGKPWEEDSSGDWKREFASAGKWFMRKARVEAESIKKVTVLDDGLMKASKEVTKRRDNPGADYITKLMGYQKQMLDAWNEFLEKRGTDFLLFDGVTLQSNSQRDYDLYNTLHKENLSRLEASSIYESREDKIKRYVRKFEEADKLEADLLDSFSSADKAAQEILTQIKKDTQSFLDDAKRTEDGMQVLMDLGWAGPKGGVKKLTASDVTLEAVLLKPERFADPFQKITPITEKEDISDELFYSDPEDRGFLSEEEPLKGLGQAGHFSGLSAATTAKLSDLRPSIDEYKKARAERDALASALTMFDQELGYMYGLGHSFYASDILGTTEDEFGLIKKGKGVFGKGERRLSAKDFERLRGREAQLAEDIEEFEEAGLRVDAKRARRERKQINKILALFREEVVKGEVRKHFKLTAKKVKKRGVYFKYIFDSFYHGGARAMDPGSMFGTLVSLSNKFNEDQYRAEGNFVQVGISGTKGVGGEERVETPTTLYYKLYKILEIRDPYKILEHPLYSNSGLYLGPILPDGKTREWFIAKKEKRRSLIDEKLRAYARDYNLDENQARRMYLRNDMLGAIYNEFIQLFTHEAGMVGKEPIVKKATDLGAKKDIVLDHLAQGLDVPFKPRIVDEDDIKPEVVKEELSKLADELGLAKQRLQQAKEQYAANKDLIDRSKRGALGVAKQRGAKSFKGVLGEVDKLKEKADKLRDDLQFAETEVTKATRAIEAIEGDPKTLTGDQTKTLESSTLTHKKNQKDLAVARKRTDLPLDQKQKLVAALVEKVSESKEVLRLSVEGMRMSGNSLDIIPSKYLSTTLQQTMPFGYTAVRSDRPSPDMPIQEGRPWDAMLASGGAVTAEESKEIGSSVGGDGVAQLLEDNRARLGDTFVDKAVAFLGNIPDKYLNELTLSIRTSLRSDKGLELGGSFMEAIKTVFIPAEGNTPDSFIHEFSHYLHAFLPKDMQSKVTDMRRDALRGVISGTKDGDLRYRLEIAEDLLSNVDSKVQFDADHFQNYLDKYGDRAKDMYHLINDNEFFAYMMTNEGQSDMTKLTPQNNPVGFISRAKQFLSDLVDWILKKARFVSAEKQFVDDVLAKFKYGDFTIERRKFTAGPALDASILTAKDLNKAIEFNVRTSLLGEEGNVEAGKKLSLEASSFHNMVYELSQKILKEMGKAEEFQNLLGKTKFKEGEFVIEPDDEITISRRAAALAGIKESEAIRKILEDNEVSTGGVVYSAEGYLELLEIRKTNPEAIPDSMWDQVSREFFKNTEEFLESYKFIRAQADKVKSEKEVEKLMALMSEVKEKFGTKDVAKKSAASFKSMVKSMFEKVKDRSAENEAIRRLTQYGFDLNQLTSQLDDKLVGPQIFRVVENFYNTIWFNEDAQIILHKGVNKDGEKATWKDLVWTYIVEKGIHEKYLHKKDVRPYRTRGKGIIKTTQPDWDRDMEAMFAEIEPIMKFAADHILKKHQNDLLLNEVSEKQLRDSFEAYTDYEKEVADLFELDEKKAVAKLLKDYTSATGDLAVANRLFLSIRRSVLAKIKKRNDILVGAELASRIVESKEFSDARKKAAYEIQAKPEEEIRFDQERAHFPHPNPEKSFTLTYDLSDIKGRERQLEGLSLYIQDINDWLMDNPEDPFVPAWKEIRDNASATMLSPTMRNGQSMKAIANMSYVRPLQNLLANIGTYTSRLAMQHLDNWSLTLERSANWRDLHQNKMAKALMDAAVSHGFGKGPIGVADWVSVVGRRYFGSANQVGRKLSIGDVVTRSDLTDVKTITKEDEAALDLQVEAFGELFDMDVKKGRGDVIASRKIKEPLRKRGRAGKERVLGRKALKVTPWTLPKTFNTLAKRFAQIVSSLIDDSNKEAQDIDAMEGINESDKRELKLKLFTRENRKGDSIMRLVSESFDRVVLPFLDNREGNITRGTNPFFTEGVYDEARDALLAGEINDMADLAAFFSERSVDITKLGEEDAPMQLNNKEALYELLREISMQAKGFNDFLSPPVDSERQDYKYQKLQHDSPFTTARQEAVANYYYYDYGSFQTVGVATMAIEAGTQYLDMYMSAMEAVAGELQAAVTDRKRAAEAGFLEDFLEQKKQGAANKEVFLDYERAEAHLANVQHEIRQLREFQDRDIKFELATNKTFRRVFGDVIGAATQILTVGIANIIGTPVRGAMRMQSMFGAAPRLNADFAWVALKEMAKGAASFGVGFTKGAFYGLGYLGAFKPRKALIKFVDEFVNQPFVKDISIGQYKINSTMRRLHDAGYAMKIDVQGKIDAYLDSVETRGRIEREDTLRTRSDTRSVLSKLYNGAALFLVEIPGMTTPRLFDAIGNNVSFAWANSAVSNLEIRLKDLHRKYGASLWDRYNDPDVLVKDPNKANTLSPVDAFGEQFIFKGDESKLGQLENIFTHGALDYHAEALRFYKLLDSDKGATFLSPDQRAQLGIGMVTSENLATVANRPLAMRNDPNLGYAFALAGWSISAAHNSIEYLSKARGGKQGWAMDSLNVQVALVAMGMMTVAGIGWASQEQILRMIYKYLFGEIKTGKHPWEADSKGEAGRRALLYALSGFPILNSLPNQMLNDQKNMAGMGPDLFIQNKLRDIINLGGQFATTRNYEGWERAILVYIKQTYPNSRYLVNRFPSISGTVDLRNNSRLIRRFAPRDMIKVSSYTGGGLTATPLTPMVALMANYATLGEWDLFKEYYRKAINEARRLGRPDPETYVRSLYFGKDPYRAALKGRPTQAVRRRVINSMSDADREEYLRVENNFYSGLTRIGGNRPSFGGGVPFTLSKPKTSRSSGTEWRPTIPLPDMAFPSPLRRAR